MIQVSQRIPVALALLALASVPLTATARDAPAPPRKEPAGEVILYLEDQGRFEVLHSRAKSTATGAVLFGLIGAGIEESSRSGKDKEKEEEILVHIPDDACHNTLVDGMTERLSDKDYVLSVVTGKPPRSADEEYVIRLKIDACGYRMANTTTEELYAYLTAQYRIYQPGERISGKLEELTMTGTERKHWDQLITEFDASVEEFRRVKFKAGRRLANKLIYLK